MTEREAEATPIGFIEEVLGLPRGYPWQRRTVAPLERAGWGKKIVQVTTLAPNEGGKSSWIVAGSGLWWLGTHPKGKVSITTKDQKQLNEQIIPAIEAQVHKLPGFRSVRSPYYLLTTSTGGRLVAYVTDDAARVEGMHGSPEAPLLEIVDEAKSVQEQIFQGIDRCGYQALIYCSSGGLKAGTFFKSHTANRDQFISIKAGLLDCPHISQDKIDRIIQKWGPNHPLTRSCLYGEFMEQDEADAFIFSHAVVMRAIDTPPQHKPGQRIGFIDCGGASAEWVLAVRDGNKTDIPLAFREADKHAACARLIRGFVQNNLKKDQIWADAADKEAIDILASLGWDIWRQNFGAPARNDEAYQSWSAEAWYETAIALTKGDIIIPNDDILIAQLTSRLKGKMMGRGKLAAEDKYAMKKRGIESPDRGDAYCGANNVFHVPQQDPKGPWNDLDDWNHENALEHGVFAESGSFAGV